MLSWFDAAVAESFVAYSASHWISLALLLFTLIVLYLLRQSFIGERRKKLTRLGLAFILILCELSLHTWYISEGVYRLKDSLPLELCSISLYMSVFMLMFRNRFLFQIVYFTGLGGASMALLTPVLGYAFPHFRFIEFFVAHSTIIIAVLYMVWVEGFRPTLRSIAITMGALNGIMLIVLGVNSITGGNYMFLARKPDTASLLDVLGPYPWYLISLEVVALIMFLLLYLPFARRHKQSQARSTGSN